MTKNEAINKKKPNSVARANTENINRVERPSPIAYRRSLFLNPAIRRKSAKGNEALEIAEFRIEEGAEEYT